MDKSINHHPQICNRISRLLFSGPTGPRTEKLWYNYPIERTHWATFAGKDFTERQRIKRKAERWARNYQVLPPAERLALLAAIMATEALERD